MSPTMPEKREQTMTEHAAKCPAIDGYPCCCAPDYFLATEAIREFAERASAPFTPKAQLEHAIANGAPVEIDPKLLLSLLNAHANATLPTPAPTMVDSEYPPLPQPSMVSRLSGLGYFGDDQMRDFVDADRASRARGQVKLETVAYQVHEENSIRIHATLFAPVLKEFCLEATRDDEGRNWHIEVTDEGGYHTYDGYWRDSDRKTCAEVLAEAVEGSLLHEINPPPEDAIPLAAPTATRPTLQSLGGDAGVSEAKKSRWNAVVQLAHQLDDAAQGITEQLVYEFATRFRVLAGLDGDEAAKDQSAALSLTSTEKSEGWLPIETAPKDGSLFLCWVSAVRYGETENGQQYQEDVSQVDFCNWRTQADIPDCGWFDPCCGQIADQQGVTHWMPLPAAPKAAEKSGRSE